MLLGRRTRGPRMNRTARLAFVSLTSLYGSAMSLGCTAKACPDSTTGGTKDNCVELQSLKGYQGTPFDLHGTWATGKNVSISSPNGDVAVDATAPSGQLIVHAAPHDIQAGDDAGRQIAVDHMSNTLKVTLDDATGAIVVSVGNTTALGADLQVHVPADFDATLTVNQTGAGSVDVTGSGKAKSTIITTNAAATTKAQNLTNHVEITGGGDLEVSASPSGPGNFYKT